MSQTRSSPASTLDLLSQRKDGAGAPWLGAAARLAGERLAADLTYAGMLPRVTMDWTRGTPSGKSPGGHGLNPTEAALAARQRVETALSAVGPEFSGVLIDVCGFDKGLERLESERNWPVRSAKVVVKLALAALARHYGYADSAAGRAGGGVRNWAEPGSRARIVAGQ